MATSLLQMMLQMEGIELSRMTASNGFFLNLSWVLLLLSAPFATSKGGVNPRLMAVDPGYCTLSGGREGGEEERYGGAVVDFSHETKMAASLGTSVRISNKCSLHVAFIIAIQLFQQWSGV